MGHKNNNNRVCKYTRRLRSGACWQTNPNPDRVQQWVNDASMQLFVVCSVSNRSVSDKHDGTRRPLADDCEGLVVRHDAIDARIVFCSRADHVAFDPLHFVTFDRLNGRVSSQYTSSHYWLRPTLYLGLSRLRRERTLLPELLLFRHCGISRCSSYRVDELVKKYRKVSQSLAVRRDFSGRCWRTYTVHDSVNSK